MAETASILSPDKTVLIPDLDAGCSLADSITAEQLRAWQAKHPGAVVVMYVNTTAEVKALTDYCVTSANAVQVVEHILREHGSDTEILFGPDMFLGAYVEKSIGRSLHVWNGECHVHAGIRPSDIARTRAAHPGADFLIHPECGCSTSVMEYVAAGDVDPEGVHMLSTGGMLGLRPRARRTGGTAIMATETGMLHPLRMAAPDVEFIAANERASCRYMKMITLPKLRDALRDGARGQGARGDRRARPRADRAHGRHRLKGGRRRPRGRLRRAPWSRSDTVSITPNTFAGEALDRAGARRRDEAWLAARLADPATGVVVADKNGVLVDGDRPRLCSGRRTARWARARPARRRRRRSRDLRRRPR